MTIDTTTRESSTTVSLRPGLWTIDPGHADVAFVGRHLGLTKVRGRFTGIDGSVQVADPIESSTIEVIIDMTTVESGSVDRDAHLRSSELFDIDMHPTATFRSTGVEAGHTAGRITGDLTIKGVTRAVTLDVDYLGQAVDPWDNERAVFIASTTINRNDWGVNWNMALDAGGLLVSKEIRIEIDVELVRQ